MNIDDLHIDHDLPIPMHEQLHRQLRCMIRSGKLPAGTQLPTENELCRALNISRPVVQAACASLIQDGLLQRIRGRGTFVRIADSRGRFISQQLNFATEMRIMGLDYTTEMLSSTWDTVPEAAIGIPGVSGGRWFRMRRLRRVEGKPFVALENIIPEALFPGIDRFDFAALSLYDVMKNVYGVTVARATRTMAAQNASAELAQLLGISRGGAVMLVQNVVYDTRDRVIEVSNEYLDGLSHTYEFNVINKPEF